MTTRTFTTFSEYDIRSIHPLRKRFDVIKEWMKSDDESIRWDCVWLVGEMYEILPRHDRLRKEIEDWTADVLHNDSNGIVRHEAAFRIGLHNMKNKIPDLIQQIKHDPHVLTPHEAIEALGLLRDHDSKPLLEVWAESEQFDVSETAIFVLKRLERLKNAGEYRGEAIV